MYTYAYIYIYICCKLEQNSSPIYIYIIHLFVAVSMHCLFEVMALIILMILWTPTLSCSEVRAGGSVERNPNQTYDPCICVKSVQFMTEAVKYIAHKD